METNLSHDFAYVTDFLSLGGQQMMYLDGKNDVRFNYQEDFSHFGKANIFVRMTQGKQGHVLFRYDGTKRHLLDHYDVRCFCKKSSNFFKYQRGTSFNSFEFD